MALEEACRVGARQVAGALLASTATTIAVFVPVLFLKDVEGQLFGDLALTISIAVAISVVVALTLLPTALGFVLDRPLRPSGYGAGWPRLTEWVLRVTDYALQAARLDRRPAARAAAHGVVAVAAARLPAPGQARGDRLVLRLPARHESRGGQPRAAADAAAAHEALHGRARRAAPQELVHPHLAGRRHHRRTRHRRGPHRRAGKAGARQDHRRPSRHARVHGRGRPVRRHRRLGALGRHPPAERGHRRPQSRRHRGPQAPRAGVPGRRGAELPQPRGRGARAARGARRPPHRRGRLGPRHPRHGGTHRRRGCVARGVLRRQVAPAHRAALQRGHDPRGTVQCPAHDPSGPGRAARRPGAAVDRARATGDPAPQSPPHGHAHHRSAGDPVAGKGAEHHRYAGAAAAARAHAARRLDAHSPAAPTA